MTELIMKREKVEPREVRIAKSDYRISKPELHADMRVNASFEKAVDALCKPVKIKYVDKPE